MRVILKARGVSDRKVYVADSFEGLPPPDEERYPADTGSKFHTRGRLAISQDTVEQTFRQYDLLDDQVVFVKGWFKDTLHKLRPNYAHDPQSLIGVSGVAATWFATIAAANDYWRE